MQFSCHQQTRIYCSWTHAARRRNLLVLSAEFSRIPAQLYTVRSCHFGWNFHLEYLLPWRILWCMQTFKCCGMPKALKPPINHRNIVSISSFPICCSLSRHNHKQKCDPPSEETDNTPTIPGRFAVWFLLAIIRSNTNQDQAVRRMVAWHRCGLKRWADWEALTGK